MSKPTARTLWNLVKIFLALLLIWLVLAQADSKQLGLMLKNILPFWGLLAALLYIGLTMLKALQYYVLLREKITFSTVLSIIIIQNAVSNFLATGAGIASYMTSLRIEHDVKLSHSTVVFIMIKIGDLFAIWLLFLLSTWMVWGEVVEIQNLIIVLILAISVLIVMFFLAVISRQRFVLFIKQLLTTTRLSTWKPINNGLNFLEMLVEIDQGWLFQRLGVMLMLSITYFVASIAWNYAIFMTFNFHVDVPALIFVNVLLQLISYFPIQIFGGLGVTESSSVYFWGLFNINHSVMASLMIGVRILYYLLNLLPLIYLPIYAMFLNKNGHSELHKP